MPGKQPGVLSQHDGRVISRPDGIADEIAGIPTYRQQVGLALGKPFPRGCALTLGTMPVAAGIVDDPPMATVCAGLDVTAKGCSAAAEAVSACRKDKPKLPW